MSVATHPQGELFLTASALAGAVHGFTTRIGGVSAGPYGSLNLGRGTEDDPVHVEENHRRLAIAAGFDPTKLATPQRQVHGATVVRAERAADTVCDCDAVVSAAPGLVLGVRTADCVPVLLWHPRTGMAGAVHAGWRGVAASIVPAAVAAMNVPASELRAAIGPAIGVCCYEVDDETCRKVRAVAPKATTIATRLGHARIDLRAGVRGQLAEAGVAVVEDSSACTSCDSAARFYSHRAHRGVTGRHLSFIVAGARA